MRSRSANLRLIKGGIDRSKILDKILKRIDYISDLFCNMIDPDKILAYISDMELSNKDIYEDDVKLIAKKTRKTYKRIEYSEYLYHNKIYMHTLRTSKTKLKMISKRRKATIEKYLNEISEMLGKIGMSNNDIIFTPKYVAFSKAMNEIVQSHLKSKGEGITYCD